MFIQGSARFSSIQLPIPPMWKCSAESPDSGRHEAAGRRADCAAICAPARKGSRGSCKSEAVEIYGLSFSFCGTKQDTMAWIRIGYSLPQSHYRRDGRYYSQTILYSDLIDKSGRPGFMVPPTGWKIPSVLKSRMSRAGNLCS